MKKENQLKKGDIVVNLSSVNLYPILKNGTVGRRGFGHGHPDWKYDNKFRRITFVKLFLSKMTMELFCITASLHHVM